MHIVQVLFFSLNAKLVTFYHGIQEHLKKLMHIVQVLFFSLNAKLVTFYHGWFDHYAGLEKSFQ